MGETKTIQKTLKIDNLNGKKIYLTSDDGPYRGEPYNITVPLLKVLKTLNQHKKYGGKVKVTLFIVGSNLKRDRNTEVVGLYKKLIKQNVIEIGNHSYSHPSGAKAVAKFYDDEDKVYKDFVKAQETIVDILGVSPKVARLPSRDTWRIKGYESTKTFAGSSLRVFFDAFHDSGAEADKIKKEMGLDIYGWDGNLDWQKQNVEAIITTMKNKLNKGDVVSKKRAIVLTHDKFLHADKYRTGDKLEKFISKIIDAKGQLELISEYKYEK